MEEKLFSRVWVKVSGDHEGMSRRSDILEKDHELFSPGHIVRPGIVIHFGRLTCGGFIKFMGKKISSIDPFLERTGSP